VAQRIAVRAMQASFGLSERRACGLVGVDRSTCRYQGRRATGQRYVSGCASWPPSAGALEIAGSMSCSAERATA